MYLISPTARREIAECGLHILEKTGSLDASERWMDDLTAAFRRIEQSPRIGRPRPELRRGLRSHLFRSHTIFYRVRPGGIEIARVLHQRRDLRKAFPKRAQRTELKRKQR